MLRMKNIKKLLNQGLALVILELFIINQTPVNADTQVDINKGSKGNIILDNYLNINTPKDKDVDVAGYKDNKGPDEYAPLKEKIAYRKKQKEASSKDTINTDSIYSYKTYNISNVVEGDRGIASPDKDIRIKYNGVTLEILKGAVKEDVEVVIEELNNVNELNPGMYNVTGKAVGYRFLPDGMKFENKVRVMLPYDKEKINSEYELLNLYTYFYDEERGVWERLEKVGIDRENGLIISATDHFTDLINSTLKMPESPKPLSYNPNSIKDIKAANPASNIPEIQGLDGGAFGSAQFSIPLTIPAGRNGMTPRLSIDYNSGNGNGWLGIGFDINIPTIVIDTKFGLPKYDENDIYLLNGEEIIPVGVEGGNIVYEPRIERSFDKIVKNGDTFEVTSKDGTKSIYGGGNAVLSGLPGIYKWYLKRVIDTNGNTIEYNYYNPEDEENDYYTYLDNIVYTGHTGGETGKYRVDFVREEREDRRVDCRGRFLTKLGSKLTEINVYYLDSTDVLIRKYVLEYGLNEFFQTKLEHLVEYDGKGTQEVNKFYSYDFEYHEMQKDGDKYVGFQEEEQYGSDLGSDVMEMNHTLGGGGDIFLGVGLTYGFTAFKISLGLNIGFDLNYGYATHQFLDINGDGLPDFVHQTDVLTPLQCKINDIEGSGGFNHANVPGLNDFRKALNETFQAGFNIGGSLGLESISGSIGGSFDWCYSLSTFTDMNGDGFIDFIPSNNTSSYLKGDGEEFNEEKYDDITVTKVNVGGHNSDVDNVKKAFHLVDSVRKWRAYHKGKININGTITKLDNQEKDSDGVKINLYKNNNSLWNDINNSDPYWTNKIEPQSEINKSVLLKEGIRTTYDHEDSVDIERGDSIYFKASCIDKIENDEINWDPEICYEEIYMHDVMADYFCGYCPGNIGSVEYNALVDVGGSDFIDSCYKYIDGSDPVRYSLNNISDNEKDRLKEICTRAGIILPLKIEKEYFEAEILSKLLVPENKNFAAKLYMRGAYNDYYYLDQEATDGERSSLYSILNSTGYSKDYEKCCIQYEYNNKLFYVKKTGNIYYINLHYAKDNLENKIINSINSVNIGENTEKGNLGEIIVKESGGEIKKYIKIEGSNVLLIVNDEGSETINTANVTPGVTSSWNGDILTLNESVDNGTRIFVLEKDTGLPDKIDKDIYTLVYDNELLMPIPEATFTGNLAIIDPLDQPFVEGCYTQDLDGNYNINEISEVNKLRLLNIYFSIEYFKECYILNVNGLEYDKKAGLTQDYIDYMHAVLYRSNITAFKSLDKYIIVNSESKYVVDKVDYMDGIEEEKVVNKGKEDNSNKDYTSYALVEDFDVTGKTVGTRIYFHVFKQSYDYTLDNIIEDYIKIVESFSEDKFNENLSYLKSKREDLGDKYGDFGMPDITIEINDHKFFQDMYHQVSGSGLYVLRNELLDLPNEDVPEITNRIKLMSVLKKLGYGEEYFKGGIYNWSYGEWNGNYVWDENKIGIVNEPENYTYLEGMTPVEQGYVIEGDEVPENDVPEEYLPKNMIDADIWRGTEFKYRERGRNNDGELQDMERYFCNYMTDNIYSPCKKGGNVVEKIPVDETEVELGDMSGMIQKSYAYSLNWGAGVSGFTFSGSVLGRNMCERDFFDINGDRYPDQLIFPVNNDRLTVLFNKKGKGFKSSYEYEGVSAYLRNVKTSTFGFGFNYSTMMAQVDAWIKKGLKASGLTASMGQNEGGIDWSGGVDIQGTVGTSKTTIDWTDINGDGLIDQVERGESINNNLQVNLNLGDEHKFDDQEWDSDGWNDEKLYKSDLVNGFNANIDSYTHNNVVRHTTTTSGILNTIIGFSFSAGTIGIGVGATVSVGTKNTRTCIDLIDMNGDGLPDEVLKISGEPFKIRFNLGDKFSDEVVEWECDNNWYTSDYYIGVIGKKLDELVANNGGSNLDVDLDELNSARFDADPFLGDMNIFGIEDVLNYEGGLNIGVSIEGSIAVGVDGLPIAIDLSTGGKFAYSNSYAFIRTMDIDGDGLPDYIFKDPSDNFIRVKINNAKKVGLLKTITTPTKGKIELDYEKTRNTVEMPNAQFVLKTVTYYSNMEPDASWPDGQKGYQYTYEYDNGYYDRKERTFYGFASETIYSPNNESYTVNEYYNSEYHNKGILRNTTIYDNISSGAPKKYAETNYDYSFEKLADFGEKEVYFASLNSVKKTFYDIHSNNTIETEMTYKYDNKGNIIEAWDLRDRSTDEDNVFIKIEYDQSNTFKYILNNPSLLQVRERSEFGNLLRERRATYDPNGNLTRLSQYFRDTVNDINRYVNVNFTYDDYGNMKTMTDPNSYWIEYTYDPAVHTYITGIRDRGGYSSSASYDYRFGVEKETHDTNNNEIRKEYDDFGRLTEVWTEYDTGGIPAVSFEYFQKEFPARAVTKNKIHFDGNNAKTLDTVIIIDGMRRIYQTKKEGEVVVQGESIPSYGMNVSGMIEYDIMGRVYKQYEPAFQACAGIDNPDYYMYEYVPDDLNYPTTTYYDVLGRTVRTILPDNNEINIEYNITDLIESGVIKKRFMTKVTDPKNNEKISFSDVSENIMRIEQFKINEDYSKTTIATTYKYNLMNEITEVKDAGGNITYIKYNTLGQRVRIDNPDSGLIEYAYDDAGNLVKKEDENSRGNGKSIIYEYDNCNRLEKITYPTIPTPTTYTYGSPGASNNRAGRIQEIQDESGKTWFEYGALGEQVKITKELRRFKDDYTPTLTYSSGYLYDYLGRMEKITYPDNEVLSYIYDEGGLIKEVYGEHRGETFNYVNNIYYDKFGQRVRIEYGNGTHTDYEYDPERRWLKEIETWGKDPNDVDIVFQDIEYDFDAVGNINWIHNKNEKKETRQDFTYDSLYQLVSAEGLYTDRDVPIMPKTNKYTQEYKYDKIGNMTQKTSFNDVEYGSTQYPEKLNYTYDYIYGSEEHPHRATKIGDWYYTYDGNGNVIERKLSEDSEPNNDDDGGSSTPKPETGPHVGWSKKAVARYRHDTPDDPFTAKYTWDDENRLIEAEEGTSITYFRYNAAGERTVKSGTYGETIYYDKMFQVLTTHNPMLITKHIFVGDTRIASKISDTDDGNVAFERISQYYYHGDHLGSSNYISDYQGKQYEHIEYCPYGETWLEETKDNLNYLNFKFTSKELDEETGLYYFGARYYDAQISKWISPDPIYSGLKEGLSIYGYCRNNPLIYHDPTGLEEESKETQLQKAWQNWIDKWTNIKLEQMKKQKEMIKSGKAHGFEYEKARNQIASAEDKLGYGKRVYALAHKWVVGLGEDIPTSEQFDEFYDAAIQGDMQAAIMMLGSIIGRSNLSKGTGTNKPQFATQEKLNQHFIKHGKEFGNITKSQYLSRAQKLVNSKPGGSILTKVRSNGDILFYNKATNEFAVKSSEGIIRTLFKPLKGLKYFLKQ